MKMTNVKELKQLLDGLGVETNEKIVIHDSGCGGSITVDRGFYADEEDIESEDRFYFLGGYPCDGERSLEGLKKYVKQDLQSTYRDCGLEEREIALALKKVIKGPYVILSS